MKRALLLAATVGASLVVFTSSALAAGGPTKLYVSPSGVATNSDKSCATAAYTSIQSAVTASTSGGTVTVCPGTYNEQVTVSVSNLTIEGSGASSIIKPTSASPTTVTDSDGFTDAAIVYVDPGHGVTLQNLVVDGSGLENDPQFNCTDDLVGILYDGAPGMIDHVSVSHVNPGPNSGCGTGLGIEVLGGSAPVKIQNSTVSDYDKNGITCNDPKTNCTVNNNTVTGSGPTMGGAQNGIQIGFEAVANLDHNSVSANDWTGTNPGNTTETQADYAAGILLYEAGGNTNVNHSTLANDQIGLEVVDSNAHAGDSAITESPGIPNSIGVFAVPCDFYCQDFTPAGMFNSTPGPSSIQPGNNMLSLDHTQISFAGSPSGSYGIWIGDAWSGNDPWGSAGTVRYHVGGSQISGAANPTVYGPRAVAH